MYGDNVRIVWKHLPLDMHKDAPLAHAASVAAHEQGRFWEYHDKLFQNTRKLKLENLREYAQELELDMQKFERDLVDQRTKKVVDADKKEASSVGITGTPGFFVNGRYLRGAKPFEEFAKLINAELAKKNIPVPAEAKAE